MEITNKRDLLRIESDIRNVISRHRLDHILLALFGYSESIKPFQAAGVALVAMRYCKPGIKSDRPTILSWKELQQMIGLVTEYLLTDPYTLTDGPKDEIANSSLYPMLLRIVANQAEYNVTPFGQYSRSMILFNEIPEIVNQQPDIPKFDIKGEFQKIAGVDLMDFLTIGFMSFAAAQRRGKFTADYFTRSSKDGLRVPSSEAINNALYQLAATPLQYRNVYKDYHQRDRRFGPYDFNPLTIYPLVRPWGGRHRDLKDDRLIIPVPTLLLNRLSTGIYHQIFNAHRSSQGNSFAKYFGHIFEAYIGKVLANSFSSSCVISERTVRQQYPTEEGKVPDWMVKQGNSLTLVECKATAFSRQATATGAIHSIRTSLRPVIEGLRQLSEFRNACLQKRPGLECFHNCTEIKPVLVTWEPMYLMNSKLFRPVLEKFLADEGIPNFDWQLITVDELDRLQPHLAAGIPFHEVLDRFATTNFSSLIDSLHNDTGKTYGDSFLFERECQFYESIGIPAKDILKEKSRNYTE